MKIRNKSNNYITLVFGFLIGLFFILFLSSKENQEQEIDEESEIVGVNNFNLPTHPDTLFFCNEKIPLEISDVKERFDNELIVNNYWHTQTFRFLKVSNRYFPEVEPILQQYGIPDDMKYLLLAESGLRNVTSPSGAKGYWQFMKKTALEYNLEISSDVDERYNLEKSTIAACKYLKKAHAKFNSWTLAAAAYNMGPSGLSKQIKRQKTDDYFTLHLNSETARYVYRIVAIKCIMKFPKAYGFNYVKSDLYPPFTYTTYEVDTSINNLIDFSREINTNYKLLKKANPWLRSGKLSNPTNKKYIIKTVKG